METTVTLTMKDQQTYHVLFALDQRRCTAVQAAELLGRTVRQTRRKLAQFRKDGLASIPHKNRGRKPHNALPDQLRHKIVALVKDTYTDANNHHLTELLAECEDIHTSVSSVRRIRVEAGLPSPRKRRPPKHRAKRERKPQPGMMLQIDGSPCRWLGDDGPNFNIIAAIDDATNEVFAVFRQEEDTAGYLLLLRDVIKQRGIPLSLYSDRHMIFSPPKGAKLSVEDQLAGKHSQSQFGRAAQELGIGQIKAHSAQAKGRVEKTFNTLQDRLVVEMRLENISTIQEANDFLPGFLKRYNARFTKPPALDQPAYRPAPSKAQLDRILCLKFTRTVAKDNTVSFGGRHLPVAKPSGPSYARKKVRIHIATDGRISFWYQGWRIGKGPKVEGELRTEPSAIVAQLSPQDEPQPAKQPLQTPPKAKRRQPSVVTPAPDHPWRKFRYGKQYRHLLQ